MFNGGKKNINFLLETLIRLQVISQETMTDVEA